MSLRIAEIKSMKNRVTILLVALASFTLQAQPQPGIDKFVPTLKQLGVGWVTNTIEVLVDPLSSPAELGSEVWLQNARKMIKNHEREAYAAVRYVYGGSNCWVWAWIDRYKSKEEIPPDWGRDKLTRLKLDSLPKVGDEVRFCQRDGLHNDLCFRRGNYLVIVEGVTAPIEKLKELAEVLDANLVKAQRETGARNSEPKPQR